MAKQIHCKCFTFSLSNTKANKAAKIGDMYLIETEAPIDKCFNDIKNNVIAMKPIIPLESNSVFFITKQWNFSYVVSKVE